MGLKIHDWMDDWFLSLSENPDRLDKAISTYETVRMGSVVCLVAALAMYLVVIFKSAGYFAGNGFMFSLIVMMLVVNLQTDVITKILKLQRQQLNRDRKDARPASRTDRQTPHL